MKRNSLRGWMLPLFVLAGLAGWQSPLLGANLLSNGDFNLPGAQNPVVVSGIGPGLSAAKNWTVFLNTAGQITTETVGSKLVSSGRMIHVITDGERNGLVQAFGGVAKKVFACVWIYLVKGRVGVGTGDGGNTGVDAILAKTGSWERVEVSNGVSPGNELIIYAVSPGGAEFYVESAEVNASRNPVCCAPK